MAEDEQEASQLIRQGRYFEQARQWYSALYIAPISERSLFLVLGALAAIVGVLGFYAFLGLMPLKERPPIMIANPRLDETVPSANRLRGRNMTLNEAFLRFFLEQYVQSREGYLATDYDRNILFVTSHSDEHVSSAYSAAVSPDNPRNPQALLGALGTRTVDIQSVEIASAPDDPQQPQSAMVRFSTEIGGTAPTSKTQWTAAIQFYYSDAVVLDGTDPETGEKTANLQEPQFQVVKYELTQS